MVEQPPRLHLDSRIHPDTVFRLQGIPTTIDRREPTKNDVRDFIIQGWPHLRGFDLSIRTLQVDPQDSSQMTATLNFTDRDNPLTAAVVPTDVRIALEDTPGDSTDVLLRLSSNFLTVTQKAGLRTLSFPSQSDCESEPNPTPGTCDWILHHETFRDWLSTPCKLLQIDGIDGSGKSHVMKRIVQYLRETQSSDGRLVLSHFSSRRNRGIYNPQPAYHRHFLAQILPHEPRYLDEIFDYASRLRNSRHPGPTSDFLQLYCMDTLQQLMKKVPLTILVDADEPVSLNVSQLQGLLRAAEQSKCDVKICVSSFPTETYIRRPDFVVNVQEHNRADLCRLLNDKLAVSPMAEAHDEAGQPELRELIQRKANGNIQWAALVAEETARQLRTGSDVPTLREQVKNYPPGLVHLYASLLKSLREDELQQIMKVFAWICFAKRPLSAMELQHALTYDEDASITSLKEHHHNSKFMSKGDTKDWIQKLSRGLVELVQDQHHPDSLASLQIQFVHGSVPLYLIYSGRLQRIMNKLDDTASIITLLAPNSSFQFSNESPPPCSPEIAQCCIRYLELEEIMSEMRSNLDLAEMMLEMHLNMNARGLMTSVAALDFWRKMETIAGAWDLELGSNYDEGALSSMSPSEVRSCTEAEFSRLCESIAQATAKKFAFADYAVHSLNYHLQALDSCGALSDALVNKAAQVPSGDNIFDSWRYLSICLRMAKLFSSPFDTSFSDPTPPRHTKMLHHVARYNLLSSLQPVLSYAQPASLSQHDGTGATPLIIAIQNSHYSLALVLIGASIDINIPDSIPGQHWTPLVHALRRFDHTANRHDDHRDEPTTTLHDLTTALTTDPRTDLTATDATSRTPLSHAAETGNLHFLRVLLSHHRSRGIRIDGPDVHGRTPFHYAACSREPLAALELLDAYCAADARACGMMMTKAAAAATMPHAPDARGRTPLSYAAETGASAVVARLLALGGIDVRRADAEGVDALGRRI
ncbi:hypothetical protein MPH_03471 [Macrophomina phaseolina MS6]|uniref:Nephrocystin 3-like N-terminal domain-containing protein n=1 Tax=Macrophomina phaseolina (strain MS6) TaxID=1126212 RepID=K2S3L9_MACPH|nr:hypothetical protein MPH_03471 [Macrophomina phaseolina MS6]